MRKVAMIAIVSPIPKYSVRSISATATMLQREMQIIFFISSQKKPSPLFAPELLRTPPRQFPYDNILGSEIRDSCPQKNG